MADAIEDGLVRLLSPAVLREIRSDESDEADTHGIGIFSENLKNLLMTQPIKGSRVLGVDRESEPEQNVQPWTKQENISDTSSSNR